MGTSASSPESRYGTGRGRECCGVALARFGSPTTPKFFVTLNARPMASHGVGMATQLIRRVSPTVRVHDLGLTSYEIGDRIVTLTDTRRKSAALLLYLVTRPGLAATREQVMDSLWPDQNPKSATNSLHQTVFFLRRDLEPWYEDGSTADYVHMETDLVFLDKDLFQVDSVAFSRQASDILSTGTAMAREAGDARALPGQLRARVRVRGVGRGVEDDAPRYVSSPSPRDLDCAGGRQALHRDASTYCRRLQRSIPLRSNSGHDWLRVSPESARLTQHRRTIEAWHRLTNGTWVCPLVHTRKSSRDYRTHAD